MAASIALLVAGCASNGTPVPDERTARAAVTGAIERGDCAAADDAVDTLDRHFASSAVLSDLRLQTAYTCIRAEDPERARRNTLPLVSGDASFTRQDYAHYLHAVAGHGVWQRGHRVASSRPELLADVQLGREVVEDFGVFVRRFPDSRYRDEALPYLVGLHEGLARSELAIARLDLDRGEYARAAARAEYVVEHFGDTNSASDAHSLRLRALELAARPPAALPDASLVVSEPVRVEPPATRPAASPAPTEPPRPAPTTAVASRAAGAVAPAVAPVTPTDRQPATAAGLEWIRAQPRTGFTIQVLGLAQEAGVRDFLSRHPMDRQTAWFRTERNGSDWFVAIAGSYPNAEAARRAIATLPAEIRRNEPWIRSFGSVQDAIR